MHFCAASVRKLDGVNNPAWERIELRSDALMLFRDTDDLSRGTRPHIVWCVLRNSHTISPCELRHCFS